LDAPYSGDDVIASSSYVLPILWCSAFTPADMRPHTIHPRWWSTPVVYPVLVTSTAQARDRVAANRPIFASLFPAMAQPFYEEWTQFLALLDHPYIMLDTLEV
jgi:hypothetical protein